MKLEDNIQEEEKEEIEEELVIESADVKTYINELKGNSNNKSEVLIKMKRMLPVFLMNILTENIIFL